MIFPFPLRRLAALLPILLLLGADDCDQAPTYAPLPQPLNALGTTVFEGHLYVYGGHIDGIHNESVETVSDETLRLDLDVPGASWERISGIDIPVQQGTLFSHRGQLYRLGGLTALNAAGEESDLYSLNDFAAYAPETDTWTPLPPMPEGRASGTVAVIDGTLYVMGGWLVESWTYHDTFLSLNLDARTLNWQESTQPFVVRDQCGGAVDGLVYVIGGMESGRYLDAPWVYDPQTNAWSMGPELPTEHPFKGFGCAATVADGRLYYSGYDGVVYRLSADHAGWEHVFDLAPARVFMGMAADEQGRLIAVGGGVGPAVSPIDVVEAIDNGVSP